MESLNILLENYDLVQDKRLKNRFFKHSDIIQILDSIRKNSNFHIREAGFSAENRSINLITWGSGPCKVFLWSQMHGDEATATMAIADLLIFLSDTKNFHDLREPIRNHCTLYILPMVNPDGAEIFTRRNALGIDINRDFHHQQSPEGRLLRALRDEIHPHFGFNLHDQHTGWSAGSTGNPATISLLAPSYDKNLNMNEVRSNAMNVISLMNAALKDSIPDHVGRFNDEHEPRAFGDNFQALGTSTILIEAGGYHNDLEKQFIRKIFFKAILSGLLSIAEKTYMLAGTEDYFAIPENKKLHFDILLKNCKLQSKGFSYIQDIGLILDQKVNNDFRSMSYSYRIADLGDLSHCFAYEEINCEYYTITEIKKIALEEPADLIIHEGTRVLLTIENGIISIK
ncbi:MAG: carboxypeptidase [Bacteroidetes bacterium]|nr:carboxypeptidase [Bacteroidota bacterium]